MNYDEESIRLHKEKGGKLGVYSKFPVKTIDDLSIAYTPGVAAVSKAIAADPKKAFELTLKKNSLAVISDGSKVLGLGNLGPLGAIPVMEGKAVLFRELASIDAFPICINTQDEDELINVIREISPVFGAINLEDIVAPKCFKVEAALQDLGIPVFHDDQHGTAIVTYAGLWNAAKVVGKDFNELNVVINGAGAAGSSIAKMLLGEHLPEDAPRVKNVIICDSKGIIHKGRENLNNDKKHLVEITNKQNIQGTLADAFNDADVFIGVSVANTVTEEMVKTMGENAIVLAMANPDPEISPEKAKAAGAKVIGTGRSDYPNQVNNALAFPGIFRGALDAKATRITHGMQFAAARALAQMVPTPTHEKILPALSDKSVSLKVAEAVKQQALKENVSR